MSALLNKVDPDGLLEYGVVFYRPFTELYECETPRREAHILSTLKEFYVADAVALVPEGCTFAMKDVKRHIAVDGVPWFCATARLSSMVANL